jgi:hypothetical protein
MGHIEHDPWTWNGSDRVCSDGESVGGSSNTRAARDLSHAILRQVVRTPEPSADPPPDAETRSLRLRISELLCVRFESRSMLPLKAVLVSRKGDRLICLDARNEPAENVFLTLHLLGHIALGHVDENKLVIRLEWANSSLADSPTEEAGADRWAHNVARGRLPSRSSEPSEFAEVRRFIRRLRLQRGAAKPLMHQLSSCLEALPGYGRLREMGPVDAFYERMTTVIEYIDGERPNELEWLVGSAK